MDWAEACRRVHASDDIVHAWTCMVEEGKPRFETALADGTVTVAFDDVWAVTFRAGKAVQRVYRVSQGADRYLAVLESVEVDIDAYDKEAVEQPHG